MNLGSGIITDIVICGILLFSTIMGAKKGVARTVVSFMQWFVCIIAGFILCDTVKGLLIDYTTTDDAINRYVLENMQNSIEDSSPYQAMPDLFSDWVNDASDTFLYGTSAAITSTLMTVIAFLCIVFGIKLVSFGRVRLFSRKYHGGVVGFFDGFMGFLFGGVRGLIYVFLLFALLVPVLGLIWPELSESIVKSMDDSYIAGFLYNNNVLLILVRDFFS